MVFNSLEYAIFLPIVFALYWMIPQKYRWVVLLGASYYFYMSWNAKYLLLIFITTVISYASALLVEKQTAAARKKVVLLVTALACLGILFVFKYFSFALDTIVAIAKVFSVKMNPIVLNLLLPVGISFYTFQTLSYVVDVYRGDIEAEHHFGYYATFVSFFPQLVAGPIERTGNLLPQIKRSNKFKYEQATYGMKLMAWGLYKKIVIADTLSKYVTCVFSNPRGYVGFSIVLALIFFAIQIYCDFSGYSDIAIGTAKLFGVELTINFKSPFFSQSIKELWSRWHITLSSWFRDYVYIPLGGSRKGKKRYCVNMLLTFFASGLWHGANWTFVIWGGMHGLAQIVEKFFLPKKKGRSQGLVGWIRMIFVFSYFCFALVFFGANSLSDSAYLIGHIFENISNPVSYFRRGFTAIGMGKFELATIVLTVLVLGVYDYKSLKCDCIEKISNMHVAVRYPIYLAIIILIMFLKSGEEVEFVYFQF